MHVSPLRLTITQPPRENGCLSISPDYFSRHFISIILKRDHPLYAVVALDVFLSVSRGDFLWMRLFLPLPPLSLPLSQSALPQPSLPWFLLDQETGSCGPRIAMVRLAAAFPCLSGPMCPLLGSPRLVPSGGGGR